MFENLSNRLVSIVSSIKGRGVISEDDLNSTLREIRVALLEADVSLEVVKSFINDIKRKIIGQEILKNIKPDQMIIKLVKDELINVLGPQKSEINLNNKPPSTILFFGLRGSGKTTSIVKVARLIKNKSRKKILLVSTDIYRPAAQEQLEILSQQAEIDFLKNDNTKSVNKIIVNAIEKSKKEFYDLLFIDTAGRQVVDQSMMNELKLIVDLTKPDEKIFVADSLTGQDAANIALQFKELIGITGIVLTRVDGDGRGGAALSIKSVTGAPIKYLGIGEKIEQIEEFYPERIAGRILGMGDIVSLVEKASEEFQNQDVKELSKKLSDGNFDFSDFAKQLRQMKKIGGVGGILSMMPGISKAQKQLAENNINEKILNNQIAIIDSMTKKERANPDLIKASRKIRISKGSGTKVQEVNKLLKQFIHSKKMMKKMKGLGENGFSKQLINKIKGNIPENLIN